MVEELSLENIPEPETTIDEEGGGEAVLLAYSPIFKIRYAADGDLKLGCTVGCQFCYYRMIKSSSPFIGTGKLARLASPEEFVEMIRESKLLQLHPLIILGARGDASMYPDEIWKVLELAEKERLEKTFLALRRPPFDKTVAEQLLTYSDILHYGTTITPRARETGTPVTEESQIKGLEKVVSMGVDPSQISIEIGPLTPRNIDKVPYILEKLKEIGFKAVIYRGVSAGSYNLPREEILRRLHEMGFIPDELYKEALKSNDYFYAIKNKLLPSLENVVREMILRAGLKPYRHTGLFYSSEWLIPTAMNRGNRVREDVYREVSRLMGHGTAKDVERVLGDLGFDVIVEEVKPGVVTVNVLGEDVITEDIAMSVGAYTRTAVISTSYMRSPSVRILRDEYLGKGLIVPPRRNLDKIMNYIASMDTTKRKQFVEI